MNHYTSFVMASSNSLPIFSIGICIFSITHLFIQQIFIVCQLRVRQLAGLREENVGGERGDECVCWFLPSWKIMFIFS